MAAIACVSLTSMAVLGLLVSEYAGSRPGVWIAKPLAATGFLAAALVSGALTSAYGTWILIGLVLSWLGDVLLIPRESKAAFRAGILSFLLGHVAYATAFLIRGTAPLAVVIAAAVLLVPAWLVLRWLRPNVGADMRGPVYAYVSVITVMVVLAIGTVAARGGLSILVGALMFYFSDLAVARERFVEHAFSNKAWGLPLYFGGQLVLALSVAL
jgi:uncharacterized membrane protein YhhN